MPPFDFAPVPLIGPASEDTLMAELLDSLEQMVRRRHLPSSWLLTRLTDGRVRMVACPAGLAQARDEAERLRNEYGPFRFAYSVRAEPEAGGVRLVVENLCRAAGGTSGAAL